MRGSGLLGLLVIGALASCAKPVGEEPEDATPRFERASADPIKHGERLAAVLGCIGCHTPDLTGEDWSEPELGVLWTANLTQSAAKFSKEELTAMITHGKRPDRALMDMPSVLFNQLHPDDVAAVVAYLKSLEPIGEVHPDPTIGPQLAEQIKGGEWEDSAQKIAEQGEDWPPDLGPDHRFARYILRATCAECHGMDLRGETEGMAGAPPRPDLRIAASYDEADFYNFLKTGKAAGGRELGMMSGVARWRYSKFTEGEAKAVRAYLVELARVDP